MLGEGERGSSRRQGGGSIIENPRRGGISPGGGGAEVREGVCGELGNLGAKYFFSGR